MSACGATWKLDGYRLDCVVDGPHLQHRHRLWPEPGTEDNGPAELVWPGVPDAADLVVELALRFDGHVRRYREEGNEAAAAMMNGAATGLLLALHVLRGGP